MESCDILIVGAGAAGIAAAKAAWKAGCENIVMADRGAEMGGILLQCFHHGFGRDENGPEFTRQLLTDFPREITWLANTTVLSVSKDKTALLCSSGFGRKKIKERWDNFTVIRNIDDIVTHVPPLLFGYYHVGNLLKIGESGKYTSIDAHRPDSYLNELKT